MSYTSITQLRARIMVLEAALRPFAHEDLSRTLGGNGHGDDSIIFQRREAVLTLGEEYAEKQRIEHERQQKEEERAKLLAMRDDLNKRFADGEL